MKRRKQTKSVKHVQKSFCELERNGWKREVEFDLMKQHAPNQMNKAMKQLDAIYYYPLPMGEYRINLKRFKYDFGEIMYIGLYRIIDAFHDDKGQIITTDEKKWVMRTFFNGEYDAIEMYPAASKLVNEINIYHLWCIKKSDKILPFSLETTEFDKESTPSGVFVHHILPGFFDWNDKYTFKCMLYGLEANALEVIRPADKESHFVLLPENSELVELFNIIGKLVF